MTIFLMWYLRVLILVLSVILTGILGFLIVLDKDRWLRIPALMITVFILPLVWYAVYIVWTTVPEA